MSIPHWTSKWREDIRRLVKVIQGHDVTPKKYVVDELQVDYYIRQLHTHSYLEPSTEKVKSTALGIVETLTFHHRDHQAIRIAEICFGSANATASRPLTIAPNIAKMLFELMHSPLSLHPDDMIEIEQLRHKRESYISQAIIEEQKVRTMARSLAGELRQLTLEDSWFGESNRNDEEEDIWSDDEPLPSPTLTKEKSNFQDELSLSSNESIPDIQAQESPPQPKLQEVIEETYQPNKPWLLNQGYSHVLRHLNVPLHFLEKSVRKEFEFVEDILVALLGVPTTTFGTEPCSLASAFWASMEYSRFKLTEQVQQQTVSHLTPACLYECLSQWSDVATTLSFNRASANYLGSFPSPCIQGFSYSVKTFIHEVDVIVSQQLHKMFAVKSTNPTLISLFQQLQPWLEKSTYLRQVIMQVIQPCENITVPVLGELVATLLTSLYLLLEESTLLGSEIEYSVLFELFNQSLDPYLNRLNDFLDGAPLPLDMGFCNDKSGLFESTLFDSLKFLPRAISPPCFFLQIQPMLLESHVYAKMGQVSNSRSFVLKPNYAEQILESTSSNFCDLTHMHPGLEKWGVEGLSRSTWSIRHSGSVLPPELSFRQFLQDKLIEPIKQRCNEIGRSTVTHLKTEWKVLDHMQAIRLFLLQQHPDSSNYFSEGLFQYILSPIPRSRWCDEYTLNALFLDALSKVPPNEPYLKHASHISIKTSIDQGSAVSNVLSLNAISFSYACPAPLNVLFRADVMENLSKLAVILLQLQGVERTLTGLKHTMRYRSCFPMIESAIHVHMIDLAGMIHFVKHVNIYFRNQTSHGHWEKLSQAIEKATFVSQINYELERWVQNMLENCFLLNKHYSIHTCLLQLLDHIINYVVQFEVALNGPQGDDTFLSLLAMAKKFKLALKNVITLLSTLVKIGSAPYLNELVLQLNFNEFYVVD
ncbi:hypothetical protein Ae201684_004702 [Aphanomyces euteiches]|uniref:Spindle pole body component n=1 Tax=Aphanomyces euteiches TaxID=100861 RepID=A0A6G0XHB1_9STRA|nr:hypothetical protein Ae201684_004702 [Aphanomyces euteiches]